MKMQIAQLKNRWQHYSPRERNLFKLCGGALCCAMVYYGAMMPLDTLIKNNEAVDSIGQRNSYVKTWGCGGFFE